MKKLLRAWRNQLQSLKLKWKVLVIALAVLLCSAVTFLLLFRYNWAAYEKEI